MALGSPVLRRTPCWFWSVPVLLFAATLELAGYAGFRVKHGVFPREFARRHYGAAPALYMGDHPYLPYIATKGRAGRAEFNSRGDRGPELETPKRRVRLLCYGGSTTFDVPHAWEETWPGRLQALLGADRYEVVIAAQNGATTADTLVNYALVHSDAPADYVLTYEGINDLESSFTPGFRPDYAHRRRKIGSTPYPFFERLPEALHYSALYTAVRWRLVGPRGDLHALFSRPGAYDFQRGPFGLATFRENLKSLHALARSRGAVLVLGTAQYYQPWAEAHFGKDFAEGWRRGLAAENEIQRELARTLPGAELAEVAASFTPTEEHLTDFCHLTAKGNELVARAFHAAVRRAEARRGASRLAPSGPVNNR